MIRIRREDFLSRLQSVQYGLTSQKEVVDQSSCFVFQGGDVITFNDQISCRIPSGLEELECAVKAAPLLKLLEKLPEDELEVDTSGGEFCVKGTRRAAGITMENEVLLTVSAVEQPETWLPLPQDFEEALQIISTCAGNDDNRFSLTCVHFAPEFVEACDNYQIARYQIALGIEEECLVVRDTLKPVPTLGMTELAVTQAWMHFRNKSGLIFSARKYLEEYPDFSDILKVEGKQALLPGGLAEAVEKAHIFSEDNTISDRVLVELRQGKMRIKGDGISGWYQEVKNMKYSGPAIEFLIAPKLLLELCKKYSECEVAPERLKIAGPKFVYVACLSKKTAPVLQEEVSNVE
jgi:DNA polymerase III sliding clamp (beta) subunit (PCNA family)